MPYVDYSKFKSMKSSDLQSLIMDTDEAKAILHRQAKRMKQCLINAVNLYYSSYPNPVMYDRTYGLRDSIEIENSVRVEGNQIIIDVGFFGDGAWGDSLFGQGRAYKPDLISFGWHTKKPLFRDVYRFGWFDGYGDLLQIAIDDFQSGNTEGVQIVSKNYYKY
jgi:hypothetical protein